MSTERQITHKVKCLTCGDTVQSFSSGDRMDCSCSDESNSRVFVAGGPEKPVLGYGYLAEFEDLSEWEVYE